MGRYIPYKQAAAMAMVDVDVSQWVECDDGDKEPLVLIETAMDRGQDIKPATVMRRLAVRAKLHAFVVLYRLSGSPNPADPRVRDIDRFRMQRIWPHPETSWTILTPQEYARRLYAIRTLKMMELGRIA
jgi:hypothetical protein